MADGLGIFGMVRRSLQFLPETMAPLYVAQLGSRSFQYLAFFRHGKIDVMPGNENGPPLSNMPQSAGGLLAEEEAP